MKINENLKNILNDFNYVKGLLYGLVAIEVEDLLEDFFKNYERKPIEFPINYEALANYLGLNIEYEDLRYYDGTPCLRDLDQHISKLEVNGENKTIYLSSNTDSRLENRTAICDAIARYIFLEDEKIVGYNGFRNSVYYDDLNELIVNIIRSFLILPPKYTTKKEYELYQDCYKKHQGTYRETIDCRILSIETGIMSQCTILAYNYLKELRCFYQGNQYVRDNLISKIDDVFSDADEEEKKSIKEKINNYTFSRPLNMYFK